jgi:hypothetical protein
MTTTKLTLEYLTKTLRVCWNAERLAAAAKLWPANPTWAWFLGARIALMTKPEAMERIYVAMAAVAQQRLQTPQRPGLMLAFFRAAEGAPLEHAAAALGAWLDDPTPELAAALLEALEASPSPGIIEAEPPPAAPIVEPPPAPPEQS